MSYGVETAHDFRPSKEGITINNLFAIGSILSGCNPLVEGCGAGVSLLSAISVADKNIITSK